MPRKPRENICKKCGRSLIARENFYRYSPRKYFPRCKGCMKDERNSKKNLSPTRVCRGCGEEKDRSKFRSDHGSSHCNECISKRDLSSIRYNDKKDDVCIICNVRKSRDQFKKLYRSGSKCIECVNSKRKQKDKEWNRSYYLRRLSGDPSDTGRCRRCGELKRQDHFTRARNYNGLSSICNECKERKRVENEDAFIKRKEIRLYNKVYRKRELFDKRLDEVLKKYPDCVIMSEEEYAGCILTRDLRILKVGSKKSKQLRRSTEHLYFKYFASDKSMDDYYVDFDKKILVKFETLSNRGRPSDGVNRLRKIERDKKRKDPLFRLKNSLTSSFYQWMQGNKEKSTWEYVDYTLEELKVHLENLFTEGMSWDNYGWDGWWIDHIIPRERFDMNNPEDIKKCWELKNLQPLWKMDNIRKGKTI